MLVAAPAAAATRIEFFTRPGCPHCERARAFLASLAADDPTLEIVEHDVTRDAAARERLVAAATARGEHRLGVPAFLVGDELVIGFASSETTGAVLRAALARRPPALPVLPLIGALDPERAGLLLFAAVLGLLDGFNPCAMWVLLFLLALLVNLRDRRRMLAVAGTFVLVSGAVYFVFLAAWLNVFLVLGAAAWVQRGLGVLAIAAGALHAKDALAPGRGPSLAIPAAAKPGLYARARRILYAEALGGALVAAATLAVAVNAVELLCSAGLPAVFTRVITLRALPAWQYYGLLVVYDLAYVLDDLIVVGLAVATLSRRKLSPRGGQLLQALSGLLLIGLGAWLLAMA